MANIKILSPKIEEYVLVVSIPLESSIIIRRNQNIDEAERSFISKRDNETDNEKKVEFDMARALLKWASCCNARLVEMHNKEHKLHVSLGFSDKEDMINFHNNIETNVYGA